MQSTTPARRVNARVLRRTPPPVYSARPCSPLRVRCAACGDAEAFVFEGEVLCPNCVAYTAAADAPPADPTRDVADLPAALRLIRPSFQHVYRIVRDHDGREELFRYEIVAVFQARIDQYAGVSTVAHALRHLRDGGHVRKGPRGWVVVTPERSRAVPAIG